MQVVFRFISLFLIFGLASVGFGQTSTKQAQGYKTFENSIVELPTGARANVLALNNAARQRMLTLHFALESRNMEELRARIARGETISPEEIRAKYSGNEEDFKNLISWLKDQGFQIIQTSANFTSVYAKATVAQIEKSLNVKMETVTYNGKTTPAATTAPQLPRDVGDHVVAIDGLQPFIQAIKHTVPRGDASEKDDSQKNHPAPRPMAIKSQTLRPKDILLAYDANDVGTGSGQKIAILIDTKPLPSDLQTFWQKCGLHVDLSHVRLIDVQGPKFTLPQREGEETLDTEWASAIAPGAEVWVYAAGSTQYAYLDMALEKIFEDALADPELRQVSISLGLREDLVSKGERDTESAIFAKLAAIGVTVFVSSGDAGSNPDATGHKHSPDPQVEYEASDPATVSVGGTTLRLDSDRGKVLDERAWAGSGGGVSAAFDRPDWQGAYASISLRKRLVPDVSSVADPNPGAFVWFKGKEWPVGGTSWSTPTWAGFSALIAEARKKQGKPAMFLGPLLYRLPASKVFRDITVGSNGAYSAGVGWDPVTGLGVPDLKAIIDALP